MATPPLRLVVDTNVLFAGLVSASSPSQQVVDALQARRAIPLLSREILEEYRTVLLHPRTAARFRKLTPRRVAVALQRLRYIGDEIDCTRVRFTLPRDPQDEKLLRLAIAGDATHLVSIDADLLALRDSHDEPARRLRRLHPTLWIVRPRELINAHGEGLSST